MIEELKHLVKSIIYVIPKRDQPLNGSEDYGIVVCVLYLHCGAVVSGTVRSPTEPADLPALREEARTMAFTKLAEFERYHTQRTAEAVKAVAIGQSIKRAWVPTKLAPRTDGIAACMVDYPEIIGVDGTMMHARQGLYKSIVAFFRDQLAAGKHPKSYTDNTAPITQSAGETSWWVELPIDIVEKLYPTDLG